MELAFDMTPGQENLFDFIDDVFAAADALYAANTPAAFGMALRFTGKTEAFLGMQQWARTCVVEIFMLRGVASTAGWITKLYELGLRHGAIPHWGLMNDLTASQVRDRYPKLSEWRQALRYIIDGGGGRAGTFRSTYSIARGLEPETYMPPTVAVPLDESGETFPYDFGTVQLHDRTSVTFHYANNGQHELKVLGHDAEGDFATKTRRGSPRFGLPEVLQNLEVADTQAVALPNEEIRVSVTFIAQRAGAHQGKLKIYVNAANLGAIVIPIRARVEAFSLAVVQPSPAGLDLGAVAIGATATATLLVSNDGTIGAWLGDVSFSNPRVGLQIAVQTGSIASGQTRTFALEYRPSFVGPLDTDVILHFTDGATPPQYAKDVAVKLSAIGLGAQAVLAPSEFDFGQAPVGAESQSTQITLRNIGLAPLSIAGPLMGGEFRLVSPLPATLAGGQGVLLEILFRPAGPGARESSFSVSSDSLYPPTPIELHGVGIVEPVLRATPNPVKFADTVAGSTRIAPIVVSNPGAVSVAIGTVSLQAAGDFQILRDRCAGVTLAVGATCEVDVGFAPTTAGAKATALEISGPIHPLNTLLSGRALPAQGLVPNVSDVDFGAVAVGTGSKIHRIMLKNLAATDAHVTDVVVQGPSAAEVNIVATDCTGAVLAPGGELQRRPAASAGGDRDALGHSDGARGCGRARGYAACARPRRLACVDSGYARLREHERWRANAGTGCGVSEHRQRDADDSASRCHRPGDGLRHHRTDARDHAAAAEWR